LYLLTYIEIIPAIIQEYHLSMENDMWSKDKKVEFLNDVAVELTERVNGKIEDLKRA